MKLDVISIQGEKTGREVELPDDIFGVEPNEHAVYLAVKQHQANQRQGTHKAKERNEVAGSTRKIKRQKGTGTARFGDIKNPIFRGGGRIFGPRPRHYGIKVNRKTRRLARISALADKAGRGQLKVVEDFSFDTPRTKAYVDILAKLELAGAKVLLVTGDHEREVYLSSRNLSGSDVVRADDLSTFDILHADTLLLSESALGKIVDSLA